MRLTGSVAVLNCSDIEQSLLFYQQALQFVVLNKRQGEHGLEWIHLKSGDTLLMLEQSRDEKASAGKCMSRLYLYADDVSSMHHYLIANGYQVGDVNKTAYMEEFDLRDPDGHRLTIGARLSQAMRT